jgi:hypothetical protein
MAILELLFELIFELLFDVFFELLKKLTLGICRIIAGPVRWACQLLGRRRGAIYVQTGRSLREPPERGVIFSPTRRRR